MTPFDPSHCRLSECTCFDSTPIIHEGRSWLHKIFGVSIDNPAQEAAKITMKDATTPPFGFLFTSSSPIDGFMLDPDNCIAKTALQLAESSDRLFFPRDRIYLDNGPSHWLANDCVRSVSLQAIRIYMV